MNKAIGIIGCGWLGLPLAISLQKKGYTIYGSTTSESKITQLQEAHINPYLISFSEDTIVGNIKELLLKIDVLIINIPPKLRGNNPENFVKKMQLLHQEIKKTELAKIIFVSSTSVYGAVSGVVTETTIPKPETEAGIQLLETENIFKNDSKLYTTIIRFGGLIGPKRHPITHLSGKQDLANGNHPINLIQLSDCIEIITSVLKNSWWNEILNGVYPEHPSKQKYYANEASKRGIPEPNYKTKISTEGKIIASQTLISVKKFQFKTTI